MLASLEWLKQYVDINIPVDVLVDKITRAGLEVETVTNLGEGLEGVLTGGFAKWITVKASCKF